MPSVALPALEELFREHVLGFLVAKEKRDPVFAQKANPYQPKGRTLRMVQAYAHSPQIGGEGRQNSVRKNGTVLLETGSSASVSVSTLASSASMALSSPSKYNAAIIGDSGHPIGMPEKSSGNR